MKKILVVTPYFYPKIGGMENYAYNISLGLKKKYKWNVVVVTSNHLERKYKIERINGIKIYRLPYWFKISNTPINPLWFFTIKKIVKSETPDIINAHSPVPFIADVAFFVKQCPFVLTYHSGSMKKGKFIVDVFIDLYEKIILKHILKNSEHIFCTSGTFKKTLNYVNAKKLAYIPPGVDTTLFKPSTKTKKENIVLYVGKIDHRYSWKGLRYLISALQIVLKNEDNIKLYLVGDGNAVNNYKEYVSRHHLKSKIKFLGQLTGKKLVKAYQQANVLVLPSITDSEAFGMVILEAMACKVPVIASRIGGIPYLIKNKISGILVPPKDINQLSKNILLLLKNENISKFLIHHGSLLVMNNYTWDIQVKKTNELFYNLTK